MMLKRKNYYKEMEKLKNLELNLMMKSNQHLINNFINSDELTKVNTELTCYEKTINCCGSFWGTLRAWCPCFCFCCPYPYYLLR